MKISIVTITYNSEDTIEKTLESVLEQKDENVEYIIVDGGSSDKTLDIINHYKNRIDKIISEADEGVSDAFNKGIQNSTGDVIGIVNSDDILYRGAIKSVRKFYEGDRSIDILYGDIMVFTDDIDTGYIVRADNDLKKLKYAFLLPHPGMFISRSAYQRYGLYSKKLKNAMDYELVSRMYHQGAKLIYAGTVLAGFREGGVSQSSLGRTLSEHRAVAKRNGSRFMERELYITHVFLRRKTAPLLKKMGIESVLHRLIKKS